MVPILTIFSSAEHIESFHPILTKKIIPDPVESGSGWIRDFFLEPDPDKNEKNRYEYMYNHYFTFFCFNCTENTIECSIKLIAVGRFFFLIEYKPFS